MWQAEDEVKSQEAVSRIYLLVAQIFPSKFLIDLGKVNTNYTNFSIYWVDAMWI